MKHWFLVLVVLVGVFAVCIPQGNAKAQEPTIEPTPTATPSYLKDVPLSSGNTLHVERTITYGDVAVVISVGFLSIITLLSNAVKIPRGYVR